MPRRAAQRITNRTAQVCTSGIVWDGELPGFGLRCLPSGLKTWVLKYRTREGAQRWLKIGSFPALTADEARREALAARGQVERGADPAGERRAIRAAAEAARQNQAGRALDRYLTVLPGRPSARKPGAVSARHVGNESRQLRLAFTELGLAPMPVTAIGAEHLASLLRLHATRPATARARFGALSRFLEWCRDEGLIRDNPATAISRRQRPKAPPPRTRVVALPELARLWRAAADLPAPYDDLARILIVLPVRRGEAARMDWRDLDLTEGVWRMPAAITKNGDPHQLALPPLALAILRARHDTAQRPPAGLVFPPRRGVLVGAWSQMRARLAAHARLSAWSWHDFRRSFASHMAERGVAEPVADAVLNHRQSATRGGVLGVYQQARRWPEQRAAMLVWDDRLAEAIAAQEAAP
jgi:integrase